MIARINRASKCWSCAAAVTAGAFSVMCRSGNAPMVLVCFSIWAEDVAALLSRAVVCMHLHKQHMLAAEVFLQLQ